MPARVMLVVRDVQASSRWYQRLLGASSGHGGDQFEMVMRDGDIELMLHHSDVAEHPAIPDPAAGTPGGGVLLNIRDADVEGVYARAMELGADLYDEPHVNPLSHQFEFSLRDPDGYAITIYRPSSV